MRKPKKSALELRWEAERAAMQLRPTGVENWRDRNGEDDLAAIKAFKGGKKTKWTR